MNKNRPGYEQIQPGLYRPLADNNRHDDEQVQPDMQEIYREINQMLASKSRPRFIRDNGVSAVRRSGIVRAIKLVEADSYDSPNGTGANPLPTSTPHPKKTDKRFFDQNVTTLLSPIVNENSKTIAGYPSGRKSRDVAVTARHSRSLDKLECTGQNKRSEDSVIVIGSTLSSHSMSLRRSRRDLTSNRSKQASVLSDVHTQTPKPDQKVESKNVSHIPKPIRGSSRDNLKPVNAKRSLSEPAKSHTNNEIAPISPNSTSGVEEIEPQVGSNQTVVVFTKVPLNSSSRPFKSPDKANTSRKSLKEARSNSPRTAIASKSKNCVREATSRSKSPTPTTSRSKSPKKTSSRSKTPRVNQSKPVLQEPKVKEQDANIQNKQLNVTFRRKANRRHHRVQIDYDSSDDDLPTKDTNQDVALSPIGTITSMVPSEQKSLLPVENNDALDDSETNVTQGKRQRKLSQRSSRSKIAPRSKTRSSERATASSKTNAAESRRNVAKDETYTKTRSGKSVKKATAEENVQEIADDGNVRKNKAIKSKECKSQNRNVALSPIISKDTAQLQGNAQIQDTSAQTCRDVGLSPIVFDEDDAQPHHVVEAPKTSHNVAVVPMATRSRMSNVSKLDRSIIQPLSVVVQRCAVALPPSPVPSAKKNNSVLHNNARKTVCKEIQTSSNGIWDRLFIKLDEKSKLHTTVTEFQAVREDNDRIVSALLDNGSSSGDGSRFVEASRVYRGPNIFESVRQANTIEDIADFSTSNGAISSSNLPWRCESAMKSAESSQDFTKLEKRIFARKSSANRPSVHQQRMNESDSDDEQEDSHLDNDRQINLMCQIQHVYTNKSTKKEKLTQAPVENSRMDEDARVETAEGSDDEDPPPTLADTSVRNYKRQNKKTTVGLDTRRSLENRETSDAKLTNCQAENAEVVENRNETRDEPDNQDENAQMVVHQGGDREVMKKQRESRIDRAVPETSRMMIRGFGGLVFDRHCSVGKEANGRELRISDLCCKGRKHRENPEERSLSGDDNDDEGIAMCEDKKGVPFYFSKPKTKTTSVGDPRTRKPSLLDLDRERRAEKIRQLDSTIGAGTFTKDADTSTSDGLTAIKPTKEVDLTNVSTQTSATERSPFGRNPSRTTPVRQQRVNSSRSFSPDKSESGPVRGRMYQSKLPKKSKGTMRNNTSKIVVMNDIVLGEKISNDRKIVELEDEGINTDMRENVNTAHLSTGTSTNTVNRTRMEQQNSSDRNMEKSLNRTGKNIRHNLFPASPHRHRSPEPTFKAPPVRSRSRVQSSSSRDRTTNSNKAGSPRRTASKTAEKSAPSRAQNHGDGRSNVQSPSREGSSKPKPTRSTSRSDKEPGSSVRTIKTSLKDLGGSKNAPPTSRVGGKRTKRSTLLNVPSEKDKQTEDRQILNSPRSSVRFEPPASEVAVQDSLISTSTNVEESSPVKKRGKYFVKRPGVSTFSLQADETVSSSTRGRPRRARKNIWIDHEEIAQRVLEMRLGKRKTDYAREKSMKITRTSQTRQPSVSTSAVTSKKLRESSSVGARKKLSKTSTASRKSRKTVELETVQEERSQTAQAEPSACNSERELASVDLSVAKKASETKSGVVKRPKSSKMVCKASDDVLRVSSEPAFSERTGLYEKQDQEPAHQLTIDNQLTADNQSTAATNDAMPPPPTKRPRGRGRPRQVENKENTANNLRKVASENAIVCERNGPYEKQDQEPAHQLTIDNQLTADNQSTAATNDAMPPPSTKRPTGRGRPRKVASENAIVCGSSKTTRRRIEDDESAPLRESNSENKPLAGSSINFDSQLSNLNDNTMPHQLIMTALHARMSQSQTTTNDDTDRGYMSDLVVNNIRLAPRGPSLYSRINNLEVSEAVEYPRSGVTSGFLRLREGMKKSLAASSRHYCIIYLVFEGEAIVQFNNQEVFLETAGSIEIPTGTEYSIENRSRGNLVLHYIRTQGPPEH